VGSSEIRSFSDAGIIGLDYKEHRDNLINNEQIPFLKYTRQYLNRNDIFNKYSIYMQLKQEE
jgi:hypothetical protein